MPRETVDEWDDAVLAMMTGVGQTLTKIAMALDVPATDKKLDATLQRLRKAGRIKHVVGTKKWIRA